MSQTTNRLLRETTAGEPANSTILATASAGPAIVTAQVLALSELDSTTAQNGPAIAARSQIESPAGANPLHRIKTKVTISVGSAELTVGELLSAREQQVLRLDRSIDQPVDILLEGQVIARGILVAVEDYFGVRLTELPKPLAS